MYDFKQVPALRAAVQRLSSHIAVATGDALKTARYSWIVTYSTYPVRLSAALARKARAGEPDTSTAKRKPVVL